MLSAVAPREELPSRAEVWSIVLGALLASVLLASAFRLSLTARAPLADEEPSAGARGIVVRPEPSRAAPRPAPTAPSASRVTSR